MKKKLVVLTGAGISAESGIKTFRDSDGLWEGHDVMEVATPEGWRKNQELVLDKMIVDGAETATAKIGDKVTFEVPFRIRLSDKIYKILE